MTQIQKFKVKITGIRPLIMHNGRLADPLDPASRRLAEFTGKRKKTQEDHEGMAEAEWDGGLYTANGRVVIPGDVLDSCMRDGGKAARKGKAIVAGVSIVESEAILDYDGPTDYNKLYEITLPDGRRKFSDRRGVGIQKARIMRTRPRFNEWSATFHVERYDFAEVSASDIKKALDTAGVAVGLLEHRPKFGLFTVDEFKQV